ncbi:MAG TPA: F0F1 ATP synthase subunit delta [Dehalococcoidia bacterium]
MRRDVTAAKRYAQAVFDLALEQETLDEWLADLERLAALAREPEAVRILESNRVPEAEKDGLLAATLSGVGPLAMNLARLLVRKGRFGLADAVAEEYRRLLEEHRGILRARAVTAVELTEPERAAVAARLEELTGKRVLLETAVDPSILGGLVVRIGDRLIDGSTRTKLLELKERLAGAAG